MTTFMNPTVAVVGPGAIGTTVAAALHEAGRTPMLCGRTARERLELRDGESLVVVPGPVRTDPALIEKAVDLVFLAVKSTQIDAAAPWLAALCHPGTVVCVLQNGVEQESTVGPHLPGCPVLPAVVWFPAEVQPDGSVWLRREARLTVPDVPAAGVVLDALRGSLCAVDLAADFTSVAWRKLLQNAVAGLMALSGRRSGMFGRADVVALSLSYLWECLEVARAEGAVLGDEVPAEIVASFQANPADLGSSILADRVAGRPLEWHIRNGVIARCGRAHGIPTPISDVVVPLLASASDGPG
jgi:2-dehydropantoate 2-reductase